MDIAVEDTPTLGLWDRWSYASCYTPWVNAPRMDRAQIEAFLAEQFPQARRMGSRIESIEEGRLVLRLPVGEQHLRPGGTVSGPALMTLADTAFYFLVLSTIGPVALAVTTHLSIDFMRRPAPVDVLAEAEMLKLGRRLAVGRVTMRSDGDDRAIAHASVTYSIPPRAATDR